MNDQPMSAIIDGNLCIICDARNGNQLRRIRAMGNAKINSFSFSGDTIQLILDNKKTDIFNARTGNYLRTLS